MIADSASECRLRGASPCALQPSTALTVAAGCLDPELFAKLRGRLGAASHDAPFVLDPTDRHRILDLSKIKLYPISKPIARTVLRGTLFEKPLDAGIVGPLRADVTASDACSLWQAVRPLRDRQRERSRARQGLIQRRLVGHLRHSRRRGRCACL